MTLIGEFTKETTVGALRRHAFKAKDLLKYSIITLPIGVDKTRGTYANAQPNTFNDMHGVIGSIRLTLGQR